MDFITDDCLLQKLKEKGFFLAERDDGHIGKYSYDEWLGKDGNIAEWEKNIFQHLKKGSVLDVGCGTGKHVAFLTNQGFDAKGIDISKPTIKTGKNHNRNIEYADFWKLKEGLKYDNIILMDSTIGFIVTPDKLSLFFKKAQTLMRNSAHLVINSVNWPKANDKQYQDYIQKNIKNNFYPGKVRIRLKTGSIADNWFEGYYYDLDLLMSTAMAYNFYPRRISYKDKIKYFIVFEYVKHASAGAIKEYK